MPLSSLRHVTGTSDVVLERMLTAFGTSPPATDGALSAESDRASLVSDSESLSDEDEWLPEARSTKNPEPYVIHRPFDFATFHRSLPSLKPSNSLRRKHSTKRSQPPGAARAPPAHDAQGSGDKVSLIRRLTNGESRRQRRRQVKLRHFHGRVLGVLHGGPDPICPDEIGKPAVSRGLGKATPAPCEPPLAQPGATMNDLPLERPVTPLCTKIARSQSLRSMPPRRKPVPRLISHSRAESEPTPYQDASQVHALPRRASHQSLSLRPSNQPPPRPPKSALRRMATVFRPSPVVAATYDPSCAVGIHSFELSSSTSFDAHDYEAPPLDSDHSDTDDTDSAPDTMYTRVSAQPLFGMQSAIKNFETMPPFLAPPVNVPR
ncbi:hypothetical protein CBS9595_000351 [Malassezia furfur]|nr:hypothetical protein CBS9595_000351 [Malassezia furfur]